MEPQILPVEPYKEPGNSQDKDDAFYSSFSNLSDSDPIDTFESINQELDSSGYSILLDKAKGRWETEQDVMKKEIVNNLLNDSTISKEEKRIHLDSYINNKSLPISLKDKYINKINDTYIVDNDLDKNDDAIIIKDEQIKEIKEVQKEESILSKVDSFLNPKSNTTSQSLESPSEILENNIFVKYMSSPESNINFGIAGALPETNEKNKFANLASHLITEPLALVDGIVGLIPFGVQGVEVLINSANGMDSYLANQAYQEVFDSLDEETKKELRSKGINSRLQFTTSENQKNIPQKVIDDTAARALVLKKELNTKYGKKMYNTVTAMFYYSMRPGNEVLWQGIQQGIKDDLNINNDLADTIVAKFFGWVDTQLTKTGATLTPNDPELVGLPLKLIVAALLPKATRSVYRFSKNTAYSGLRNYADSVVSKRAAKDARGIPGPREIKDVKGETVTNDINPAPPNAPKTGPDINIKLNSPIATTTLVNPKAGIDIMNVFTLAPETGPKVGLNIQSFLHQAMDGNNGLVGTNQIGSPMDVRNIPEVLQSAERQAELALLDPLDIYYNEKVEFISGTVDTINSINNIKVDVPIIVSPTFSVKAPTYNGFIQSTVIRRTSQENYKTRSEVRQAYEAVEKAILERRENKVLEPNELVIERVQSTGMQAWNVIESYTPKTYTNASGVVYPIINKPTGRTKKSGEVVKASVSTSKTEIRIDRERILKGLPPNISDYRFFHKEGKIIGRDTTNPAHRKDLLELPNNSFEMVLKTKEDYVSFVIEHEIAHIDNPKLKGESANAYEDRVSKIGYEKLNLSLNDGSTYIVRWTKQMDQTQMLIEDLHADYGTVPSKRTNKFDAALQNSMSMNLNATGGNVQLSEFFTPYGQFTAKFDQLQVGYLERAEYHKNAVKDEMVEYVLKNLSSRQQKMFGTSLRYSETSKFDTLSVGELRNFFDEVAPEYGTPRTKTLEKIKQAHDAFRFYSNQKFVLANLSLHESLRAKGYDKSFYYVDPVTKVERVIPVLDPSKTKIERGDLTFYDESGNLLSIEILLLDSNKAVLFNPNVRDYMMEDGIWSYQDGLRQYQVYRVASTEIMDPILGKDGKTYDYVAYPGLLPSELPTIILPRKPGYIARIQESNLFGVKYPLSHIHNGSEVGIYKDKNTGEIIDVSKLDYGNEFEGTLTAQQLENRNILTTRMTKYSSTVAARDTVNELQNYIKDNPDVPMRQVLDSEGEVTVIPGEYIIVMKKATELSTRDIKSYYETANLAGNASKYRNELLDSKIVGDPFRSEIKTGNQINSNFATQQYLKQAEQIFVELYVKPGPSSDVSIVPNAESLSTPLTLANELQIINQDFPLAREQILVKGKNVEEHNQALRMYDKIRLARYGRGTKFTANYMRKLLDMGTDAMENNMVRKIVPEKMLDGVVMTTRELQKYSDVAVMLPSTITVHLGILMKPWRQLFIQAPVFASALLVASSYDPVKFAHNLKDIMALAALDGMSAVFKKSVAWEETYKYIWESERMPTLEGEYISAKSPKEKFLSPFTFRFNKKDYLFILQMKKEHNFAKLSSHEWLPSMFAKDITGLGNPRSSNAIMDVLNPKTWFNRVSRGLAKGFQFGEGIGRDGMLPVMIRNWMYKNPEKAHLWKRQENVTEWMQDSIKGTGWMSGAKKMGWQEYAPMEAYGKFEGFSQKQAAVLWNADASGFKGKRRWEYIISGLILTGTLPYAMQSPIKEMVGAFAKFYGDKEQEFEAYFARLNLADYLGNMWANYGEDLTDEEKADLNFGESIGLFGFEDTPFFFWQRAAQFVGLYGDDSGNEKDLGAVYGTINQLIGENKGFSLMYDFWAQPNAYTYEEKLEATARIVGNMAPFLKPVLKFKAEKYLGDRFTKTGQPTGTGTSESENLLVTIMGVQDYADQFVWDTKKSQTEKSNAIRSAARSMMVQVNLITNGKPTWRDVKSRMNDYEVALEDRKFLDGSAEHAEFRKEVWKIIQKQHTSLLMEVYNSFIKKDAGTSNINSPYYSENEINIIEELGGYMMGKYPKEANKIKKRIILMKQRNKQYEKDNK